MVGSKGVCGCFVDLGGGVDRGDVSRGGGFGEGWYWDMGTVLIIDWGPGVSVNLREDGT